jgi:hypothetical protein
MTGDRHVSICRTMRAAVLGGGLLASMSLPAAQAPAPTATAGTLVEAPVGTVAQLMRGIHFPNSNLIFTVQTHDPAAPPKPAPSGAQSDGFSVAAWGAGIYTGWQVVDNAAVALIDVSPLLLVPGLKCENGRDAPVGDPEWIEATQEMIAVAKKIYGASRDRNRERVSELTGDLSDSCAACHRLYRDVRPREARAADPPVADIFVRCQPRRPR